MLPVAAIAGVSLQKLKFPLADPASPLLIHSVVSTLEAELDLISGF